MQGRGVRKLMSDSPYHPVNLPGLRRFKARSLRLCSFAFSGLLPYLNNENKQK